MRLSESALLRRVLIKLSDLGCRLFRNNCGMLRDARGSYVRYGVASPGGSDLVGWHSITITPDFVGRRVAIFTAIECKSQNGRLTKEQANFLAQVEHAGGIAIECRDVDESVGAINQWRGK